MNEQEIIHAKDFLEPLMKPIIPYIQKYWPAAIIALALIVIAFAAVKRKIHKK